MLPGGAPAPRILLPRDTADDDMRLDACLRADSMPHYHGHRGQPSITAYGSYR